MKYVDKYYINNNEVSEDTYCEEIYTYILKDVVDYIISDPDFPADQITVEELYKDDGIHYEVEGIDENTYFDQQYDLRTSGQSEIEFYHTKFKIIRTPEEEK